MAITILWAQLFFILLYILSPFVFVAFSFNNSVCLLIHSFVHSIYTFLRLFQWKCIEPKSCIPTNKVKRFALFANVYTILELHRLCTHGSCAHEMNRVASSLGGVYLIQRVFNQKVTTLSPCASWQSTSIETFLIRNICRINLFLCDCSFLCRFARSSFLFYCFVSVIYYFVIRCFISNIIEAYIHSLCGPIRNRFYTNFCR